MLAGSAGLSLVEVYHRLCQVSKPPFIWSDNWVDSSGLRRSRNAAIWIGEQFRQLCRLAVDFDCVPHQPGAVAVIDVAVPVDDRERLDRLAVELRQP